MKKMFEWRKEDRWLLVFTLLLGCSYNYLFYGNDAGISVPIAVFLFYCLLFWSMKERIQFKASFAWVLLIPIMLLSLTYIIFSNTLFQTLNALALPLLITAQTLLLTRNYTFPWYRFKFVGEIFGQMFSQSFKNFPVPFRLLTARLRTKFSDRQYKTTAKVLLGLCISLPLLGIVTSLLISADKVFEEALFKIPNFFAGLHAGEVIIRSVIILFIAVYVFSYIWRLLHYKRHDIPVEDVPTETSVKRQFSFDPIVTLTVLIVVNLLYLLFTLVQFSYLFGSGETMLPTGTTYAEHARSGFGELVVVTVINFSILLLVIQFIRREAITIVHRLIQSALSLLVGSTSVMLCSSFVRLNAYEQAYGYTYTRVLVHAFLIFLFVLFIIALYRIWREQVALLKPYIIIALIAFVVINYMNIDQMIVVKNIERYEQTGNIDLNYLGNLSYDVVPELVQLSKQTSQLDNLNFILDRMKENLRQEESWPSFNLSKHRARELLGGE